MSDQDRIDRQAGTRRRGGTSKLDYSDEAGRGSDATSGRSACGSGARCGRWSAGAARGFRAFRIDRIASITPSGRSFRPERGKQLADFYRAMEMREAMPPRANGNGRD